MVVSWGWLPYLSGLVVEPPSPSSSFALFLVPVHPFVVVVSVQRGQVERGEMGKGREFVYHGPYFHHLVGWVSPLR